MDISGGVSGWSSGCESGWTSYLDESCAYTQWQTSMNLQSNVDDDHRMRSFHEEDEEEDMSMLSDASSGPAAAPTFFRSDEDDPYCDHQTSYDSTLYATHSSSRKKKTAMNKKAKGKEGRGGQQQQQHSNFLDDTASSPAMAYSKRYASPSNNQEASIDHLWGFSQDFSAAQVQQGSPAMFNHLGGHWQASYPKDSDSAEPSSLRGGRW